MPDEPDDFRTRQIAADEWIIEEKGFVLTDPDRWVGVTWRKLPNREEAEAVIKILRRRQPAS
jgi:hypothetical protein